MAENLSPLQFGGDEHLPGLSEEKIADAHPQNSRSTLGGVYEPTDKEWAHMDADRKQRQERSEASGPLQDRWTGPDPMQRIMGVHDLAANNGQPDAHGFISERRTTERGEFDPTHPGPVRSVDNHSQGGNGIFAQGLYRRYGGARSTPENRIHWASQPLEQVPTSTPVHTMQNTDETELGRSRSKEYQALFPGRREGRERINDIREDLERGNEIRRPAWLARHNGRLIALDGHHRIVAAREAGLDSYPARVWDMDAQRRSEK